MSNDEVITEIEQSLVGAKARREQWVTLNIPTADWLLSALTPAKEVPTDREIFDAGFRHGVMAGDNHIHHHGEQADRIFERAMEKLRALAEAFPLPPPSPPAATVERKDEATEELDNLRNFFKQTEGKEPKFVVGHAIRLLEEAAELQAQLDAYKRLADAGKKVKHTCYADDNVLNRLAFTTVSCDALLELFAALAECEGGTR